MLQLLDVGVRSLYGSTESVQNLYETVAQGAAELSWGA